MDRQLKLLEILNKQLGLTPYESRAYLSLMTHGPQSPSQLAQRSEVPRPRTYDVLQSLMEKGLLIEQSGKPSIYSAVEPSLGLKNLLVSIEMQTTRQLEDKRKAVQVLVQSLSESYEEVRELKHEKGRVWFTRRDAAFIAIYCEAVKKCKEKFIVASRDPRPPEKEILDAAKVALEKGKSIRVIRQITEAWTLEDLERYEELIDAGSQVRHLPLNEIPLRFTVFDEEDIIIVFPPNSKLKSPQTVEALWLRAPPLGKILCEHFEALWKNSQPILPLLREIKKKKQTLVETK